MINHNIEWLYRLLKQPQRIFRQVKILKFMLLVIINKIRYGGKESGQN